MSYLKSATLNKQKIERERQAEKTRYGKPYSTSIQSKPNTSTNTNAYKLSSQLDSISIGSGMPMFTVSSPQKMTGKPKPSTQTFNGNIQNKRPQTTTGIYEKTNVAIRKPGSANGRMATVNASGPYSNEVGGFGKGDNMNLNRNRNINRNPASSHSTSTDSRSKILSHDTKIAKNNNNLKPSPIFSVQEKQRHEQGQQGRRTEKIRTNLVSKCRKGDIVKEDKSREQEQSKQNQVSFQSQRSINVDITSGDTDADIDTDKKCKRSGIPPQNIINRIDKIGDGENLKEEDTVKPVDEEKVVAITEIFSRRSSSSKSDKAKSKSQVQNQGQMSPPTSAVSSASEIATTSPPPTPLKTEEKRDKTQQRLVTVALGRENTGTKFEYRARMEEILAQPMRDLVSFSKGVLLLRHHDKLEGNLRLTNVSSEPICFRITSSIANRYKIEPKIGAMDADDSIAIRIRTKQPFKENTIKRDRFTIESAITPEFPMTSEQVVQFWKKIPQGKVQKAQTNVTFIFDSADPKFRAILGGGTGHNQNQNQTSPYIYSSDQNKVSSLKQQQLQVPTPKNNIQVKKSTSSELTTCSSRKNSSSTCTLTTKKNASKDIVELIPFDTEPVRKSETRIVAVAANEASQRGPMTSFLIFILKTCPIAAGFMFFVYQAIKKHNPKLLG